jgi:hypothetical protein
VWINWRICGADQPKVDAARRQEASMNVVDLLTPEQARPKKRKSGVPTGNAGESAAIVDVRTKSPIRPAAFALEAAMSAS